MYMETINLLLLYLDNDDQSYVVLALSSFCHLKARCFIGLTDLQVYMIRVEINLFS